jgi:hypothetical protein
MNSTTGCIELTNGFSFTINRECIQIITGLPIGCLPISFSSNSAIVQRVNLEIHKKPSKPSVHELAEIIKKCLSGPPFAKAFVLLANCLLLSPTNKCFSSSMHYQAIDDYDKIKEYDWCSYVLHWLLISVNKFQLDSCIGTCSGCRLILVVCIAFLSVQFALLITVLSFCYFTIYFILCLSVQLTFFVCFTHTADKLF